MKKDNLSNAPPDQTGNGDSPDPLRAFYHEPVIENPAYVEYLVSRDTALLCIDMQYLDAAEGEGIFAPGAPAGMQPEAFRYYFDRPRDVVIPNMRKLQDAFRVRGLEVIHTRIQSLTRDGRDRSAGHKRLQLLAPPGSREAEFLPPVAPQGDEIIINKTASGVFSSTNLHYILTNLDINSLYICGVYTNECVETTVRDACDLGYFVSLIEDCCATVTPGLQEASLATLRDRYCRIVNVQEALQDLRKHVRAEQSPTI